MMLEKSNRKKKILLATASINLRGGGISSYAVDFCNLFNQKLEIYIISGDIIDEQLLPLVKDHIQLDSAELTLNNLKKFLDLAKSIKPDIIINSNFRLLALAIPYINSKIIKISISHFIDGQLAIVAGYNHKHYDTVIALSKFGKKYIDDYYNIKDSILTKVIYNSYRTKINTEENYLDSKIQNKTLIITYPGGASLHKNPFLVYNLVKELQKTNYSFKFYWLGNTQLPGGKFLPKEYISDLIPSDERIIFTGVISRQEALEKITNANIFLLPSFKEGCPISLLEAISSGVIPIVSDSKHASSELIENGVSGFVLPEKKVSKYFNLIERIINNHLDYVDIYINSKKLHQSKLSGDIWAETMEEIFVKRNNKNITSLNINKINFMSDKLKLKFLLNIQRIKSLYASLHQLIKFKLF